jgi:hypothetical protein
MRGDQLRSHDDNHHSGWHEYSSALAKACTSNKSNNHQGDK